MTEINRHNYEEYFVDFLDGKLDSSERMLLMSFLDQNPDLKEELKSFENEMLVVDEIGFNEKNSLKKNIIVSDIKTSNFDELCIAKIEGDLNKRESLEFDKFIAANGKQKDVELYELTKFTPDFSIKYENKDELKLKSPQIIRLNTTSILSIAASIVLLISVYIFIPKNQNNQLSDDVFSEIINVEEKLKDEVKNTNSTQNQSKSTKNIKSGETDKKEQLINVKVEEKELNSGDNEDGISRDQQKIAMLEPLQIQIAENDYKEKFAINKVNYISVPERTVEQRNYISFKSYLVKSFNSRVLNKEDKDKIEMFDIAQAGVDGINKLTGSKMSLERIYDENGNPDKTAFNSRLIAFSTPIKK